MIDLKLDLKIDREIKRLKQDFQSLSIGGAYRVPFKQSGTLMLASTDKNFKKESTPDGKKWKALKPATLKRRKKGRTGRRGKILQDTGQLKNSPNFKAEGTNRLIISENRKANGVDIAAVHQFGAPKQNIPARPSLGFSRQDADDIALIFSRFAAKKLKTK